MINRICGNAMWKFTFKLVNCACEVVTEVTYMDKYSLLGMGKVKTKQPAS